MTGAQLLQLKRNLALTTDVLRQVHLVTVDRSEQIGALITAATVLIEKEVGASAAGAMLEKMIAPSLEAWSVSPSSESSRDH
jgi:hypothetical protein